MFHSKQPCESNEVWMFDEATCLETVWAGELTGGEMLDGQSDCHVYFLQYERETEVLKRTERIRFIWHMYRSRDDQRQP